MAASKKLLGDVERGLKKVSEGVECFEEIWNKIHNSKNINLKKKYEYDLQKEIKKLQRMRDQIKVWLQMSEIKDKTELLTNKRLIETQMERFKIIERETKTKAYSKEGLDAGQKMDPAQRIKDDIRNWLTNAIYSLQIQMDQFESEIESLQGGTTTSKKKRLDRDKQERLDRSNFRLVRHKWHVERLETILRLLDNDTIGYEPIHRIRDDVQYYIDSSQELDFLENLYLYEDILVNFENCDSPRSSQSSDEDTILQQQEAASLTALVTTTQPAKSASTSVLTISEIPTINENEQTMIDKQNTKQVVTLKDTRLRSPKRATTLGAVTPIGVSTKASTSLESIFNADKEKLTTSTPYKATTNYVSDAINSQMNITKPMQSNEKAGINKQEHKIKPLEAYKSDAVTELRKTRATYPAQISKPSFTNVLATGITKATDKPTLTSNLVKTNLRINDNETVRQIPQAPKPTIADVVASGISTYINKKYNEKSSQSSKVIKQTIRIKGKCQQPKSTAKQKITKVIASGISSYVQKKFLDQSSQMSDINKIMFNKLFKEGTPSSKSKQAEANINKKLCHKSTQISTFINAPKEENYLSDNGSDITSTTKISIKSTKSVGTSPMRAENDAKVVQANRKGQIKLVDSSVKKETTESFKALKSVVPTTSYASVLSYDIKDQTKKPMPAKKENINKPMQLYDEDYYKNTLIKTRTGKLNGAKIQENFNTKAPINKPIPFNSIDANNNDEYIPTKVILTSTIKQRRVNDTPNLNKTPSPKALSPSSPLPSSPLPSSSTQSSPLPSSSVPSSSLASSPLQSSSLPNNSMPSSVLPNCSLPNNSFQNNLFANSSVPYVNSISPTVSVSYSDKDKWLLKMMQISHNDRERCEGFNRELDNLYAPHNVIPEGTYYPKFQLETWNTTEFYDSLETNSLFFIFYYTPGSLSSFLAAKSLKKLSWRFHFGERLWFKRLAQPKILNEDYEQGNYLIFNTDKWMEEERDNFIFEYKYLEDDELL